MHTQLLPYQKNTADLFEHFVHLPNAVLLDSCLPQQKQGRYDIITAEPYLIIRDEKNIFEKIQAELIALKNHCNDLTIKNTYPFTVGAIGYFSYDMGKTCEKIPSVAINDIALPSAWVGFYDWSIVVDHVEQKTMLTSLHATHHPKIKKILGLLTQKPMPQQKYSLITPFQSNMSQHYYERAFDVIKKNIVHGNCYQVNFAQRFSAEFTGSSWQAYRLLREKNPAPYAAFMKNDQASVLCLSPERFLKVTDRIVETKPIKGTSKRFKNKHEDALSATALLHSEKDRAENVMIVDLLRNDLSRTCTPGSVQVSKLCALESFSNVHHLVSTITGQLADHQTALDVLRHAFPGGSITGAPKIAAMKIIESLEPHQRSLYCGNLFYNDIHGNLDSNIMIRTVICDQQKMHCYAGGGIVYDSDCEKEYAETWAKVMNILMTLQKSFQLPATIP